MKTAALALCFAFGFAVPAGAAEPHPPVAEVQHAHAEGVPHEGISHAEAIRRPGEPQRVRTCFNAAETREKVVSRRLSEPFRLLRGAAGRVQGEALRARLCRWNEDYVYEIALLRRDGHIVHVYLNAVSGQSVAAFDER